MFVCVFYTRNGVKITFQFQAYYFGVSQLSFEANSGLFNKKDRMDGGKRMASNWEVVLTPFLNKPKQKAFG